VHLQHLKIQIQLHQGIVRDSSLSSFVLARNPEGRADGRLRWTVDYSELYTLRWRWMGGIDNERDCKTFRRW
jgi:hypothetical protein